MRNTIVLALSILLLLLSVGMFGYNHAHSTPCLLPSNDAGFVETTPVVCVNTGLLATSEDVQTGNYYQEECKPGLPVPCATVYLVLFAGGKPTSKILTNVPSVADYFMRQGYVPVPETYYQSIEL